MENILQNLENLINLSLDKTADLQSVYTSYVSDLLDEINSPIETDIRVILYNGSVFTEITVLSVYKNEELEIMLRLNDKIISWNDLNIFSMDIIVNRIHIQLLTEINMFKLSNNKN
ncbi:MAG: hypothetical protein JW982_05875 [Spirochaetes bacterium]|nr:hypothetical protein [Spirochaetota bacterium]